MPLIIPSNSISGEFEVANSLRFNDGSSDYLNRTLGTPTNNKKWTLSFWFKKTVNGANPYIFTAYNSSTNDNRSWVNFQDDDTISIAHYDQSAYTWRLVTNRLFRDVSAWYHIVVAVDTTQGTAANRVKLYINSVQETSFSTENYPDQNYDPQINSAQPHNIGRAHNDSAYVDGYIAEMVLIDGQQLDATSFGEFDEDSPTIWKPKNVSGLTFGDNGFYLNFENSGSLGADVSGNGNNFTVNNLTSIDQTTDTCTNNFATLNGVSNPPNGYDLSEGNLKASQTGSSFQRFYIASSIAPSQGKWYWESKLITSGGSDRTSIGICSYEENIGTGTTEPSNELSIVTGTSRIRIRENGSTTEVDSFYTVPSGNDIFMYALDLDNTKFYFGINGNWWNYNTAETGGDPTSGSGYVTNSTNIIKGAMSSFLRIDAGAVSTTFTNEFNFGNPPYTISSGNSDGNGYGNFEYAVPSGYYSLNTKNLAEYG